MKAISLFNSEVCIMYDFNLWELREIKKHGSESFSDTVSAITDLLVENYRTPMFIRYLMLLQKLSGLTLLYDYADFYEFLDTLIFFNEAVEILSELIKNL